MKEFADKLIERLEERKSEVNGLSDIVWNNAVKMCIDEVNQLAEEYNKKYEPTMDLLEYGVDMYNLHLKEQYRKGYEDAKKENDWIPCSERLPENDKYVFLSFSNFSLPVIGRYEEEENGGAFYIGDEDESCVSQDLFVNAWMELPQSYKESDKE